MLYEVIMILGAGGAGRAVAVETALAGAKHITIVNIPQDEKLAASLIELLKTKTGAAAEYIPWTDAFKVPLDCDIFRITSYNVCYTKLLRCKTIENLPGIKAAEIDGVGMCFPDVVVSNKIVGGEVYKTRGIRNNPAIDYEQDFRQLTDLNDRIRELIKPGGNA